MRVGVAGAALVLSVAACGPSTDGRGSDSSGSTGGSGTTTVSKGSTSSTTGTSGSESTGDATGSAATTQGDEGSSSGGTSAPSRRWIAVGSPCSTLWLSDDGYDWIESELLDGSGAPIPVQGLGRIAFGDGAYITTGSSRSGPVALISYDAGTSWERIEELATAVVGAVVFGNGRFVMTGSSGGKDPQPKLYTHEVGGPWMEFDQATIFSPGFNGSFFGGFVEDQWAWSDDGVTWTPATSVPVLGFDSLASSMQYVNGLNVQPILDDEDPAAQGLWVSQDGSVYEQRPLGLDRYIIFLEWLDDRYVAGTIDPQFPSTTVVSYISDDLQQWTEGDTFELGFRDGSVHSSDGLVVAVGDNGFQQPPRALWSTDGLAWNTVELPGECPYPVALAR